MSDIAAIDQEIERDLYALLRDKTAVDLEHARLQFDTWQGEVERLELKITRIEERMIGATKPVTPKTAIKGKGGRVKAGLSDKLVAEFLKAANGVGASMDQITSSTGTTTSSARRSIRKLVEAHQVEVLGRARWRWKTPSPPSKNLDDY